MQHPGHMVAAKAREACLTGPAQLVLVAQGVSCTGGLQTVVAHMLPLAAARLHSPLADLVQAATMCRLLEAAVVHLEVQGSQEPLACCQMEGSGSQAALVPRSQVLPQEPELGTAASAVPGPAAREGRTLLVYALLRSLPERQLAVSLATWKMSS